MASKISRSQDFIEISGFLWDFKISQRFQDLTISRRFHRISLRFCKISLRFQISRSQDFRLRSQDFCGISRFHRDFKISHRFQDLTKISQDLTEISQDRSHSRFRKISNFTEIIGKILLGISDLKQDFSSDFNTCIQDFTLLRIPWARCTIYESKMCFA